MGFRSKAQMAKMAELEKAGKVAKGTTKKWAAETKDTKKLPERVTAKKPIRSMDDLKKAAKKKGC